MKIKLIGVAIVTVTLGWLLFFWNSDMERRGAHIVFLLTAIEIAIGVTIAKSQSWLLKPGKFWDNLANDFGAPGKLYVLAFITVILSVVASTIIRTAIDYYIWRVIIDSWISVWALIGLGIGSLFLFAKKT